MQPVQFQLLSFQVAQHQAAMYLADYLRSTVSQQPTLLLLSGGSAVNMYTELFTILTERHQQLEGVTVSLVDERFVPTGHADSNATQLEHSGVIKMIQTLGGTWIQYLQDDQESGAEVADRVSALFSQWQLTHQVLVLAGLGDDAHTAGLLPTNDGQTIKNVYLTEQPIAYYQLPADVENPYRHRLTTTPHFLAHAQTVIVYATGAKKAAALRRLVAGNEPISTCPALALRASQQPVIVLTDQSIAS